MFGTILEYVIDFCFVILWMIVKSIFPFHSPTPNL